VTAIDLSGGQVRASGVTVKLSNTGKVLFPGGHGHSYRSARSR
jgi:hypothetical protein